MKTIYSISNWQYSNVLIDSWFVFGFCKRRFTLSQSDKHGEITYEYIDVHIVRARSIVHFEYGKNQNGHCVREVQGWPEEFLWWLCSGPFNVRCEGLMDLCCASPIVSPFQNLKILTTGEFQGCAESTHTHTHNSALQPTHAHTLRLVVGNTETAGG